jgi:hypothetical protein
LRERLEPMMLGMVMANGRRTVNSWFRAAGLKKSGWKDYFFFAVGKVADIMAMMLLRLLVKNLLPKERPPVLGNDNTPNRH